MSGNGSIITGIPLAEYQTEPQDTRPDLTVGDAFGRKVSSYPAEEKFIVSPDTSSPTSLEETRFTPRTLSERNITAVEPELKPLLRGSINQALPTESASSAPAEVLASHSLVSTDPQLQSPSDLVDQKPVDHEENPFLKADGKKLKSGRRNSAPEEITHHSFLKAARKVQSLSAAARSMGASPAVSKDVLMGFDKVANYENQGIPPDYLAKMQSVADEENVIIAVRPVEKICRTLIEEGYRSKGLNIKGKSSNWGPMAGFIPVDQHFSKLSGNPDRVAEYNKKNHEAINVKQTAPQEQLHISGNRIKELQQMGILNNSRPVPVAEGYSQGLCFESSPKGGPTETFEAQQRSDGQWDVFSGSGDDRKELMVIPLTADFDLLFVHSSYEDVDLGQQDRHRPFHPTLGVVSEKKEQIINALNTRFDRGSPEYNMVHHGMDTENPVTDMDANLPATVVIPEKMLSKMGIYSQSPVLIKSKEELARLYRTMQASGIRVEANELWGALKKVTHEPIQNKIDFFDGRRKSV